MKKQLAALATMTFVALFVISLGEAVTFRFVEVPDEVHNVVGGTFTINFVINAADAAGLINGVTIVAEYNDGPLANNIEPVNAPPFTVGSYLAPLGAPLMNKIEGNKLTLVFLNLGAGVAGADDQIMASVEFRVLVAVGSGQITYDQANSKYSIFGEAGSFIPDFDGDEDITLPVQLSAFTAVASDKGVVIKWRAESEVNNLGFSIYRSEENNGKYIKRVFVSGAGSSAMPTNYQFIDEDVEQGSIYFYYLEDVDITGEKSTSKVIKVVVPPAQLVLPIPKKFRLLQNYPNPFNPETWIPYQLREPADVFIRIYDANGRLVRTLSLGHRKASFYLNRARAAYWDGKNEAGEKVASGIYFYQLNAGDFSATRRMLIVK